MFNYLKNIIFENKNALLLSAFLLCAFGYYACEFFYAQYIDFWDSVYPFKYPSPLHNNPHSLKWHILKWKLFATERMCIGLLVYFLLPEPVKKFPWKKLAFIYFQLGFENFTDRIFFNAQEFGFNDYIVYAWVIVYSLQAIGSYASKR